MARTMDEDDEEEEVRRRKRSPEASSAAEEAEAKERRRSTTRPCSRPLKKAPSSRFADNRDQAELAERPGHCDPPSPSRPTARAPGYTELVIAHGRRYGQLGPTAPVSPLC